MVRIIDQEDIFQAQRIYTYSIFKEFKIKLSITVQHIALKLWHTIPHVATSI